LDGAQVGAASGANSRAPARSGERERANDCERMAQVVEAERHGGQASREWEGANASAKPREDARAGSQKRGQEGAHKQEE
jgi:hypothetical protein